MQIHQILIRPNDGLAIIVYVDQFGKRSTISFDCKQDDDVAKVVSVCESRLANADREKEKAQWRREMTLLERRVAQLREALAG